MERLGVFDTDLAAFDLEGAVREHRRAKWHRRLIADVEDHLGELHCWPYKEQRFVLDAQPVGRKDIFRFVLFAQRATACRRGLSWCCSVGLGCCHRRRSGAMHGTCCAASATAHWIRTRSTGTWTRDAFSCTDWGRGVPVVCL